MASLEEKTLALTNLHILNSKRKQGNLLSSLKRKKSIQMRGQHNSPRASAGIIELKKLRGKVKCRKDHLAIEVWKPGTETDLWYDNISKMDVERSEKPSDELVLQKETSVDNLAYPACCTESHQAWIKWVNCSVSADARRLVALQNCLKELKISIQTSDTKCQLSISELNAIKTGVKEAEGGIKKLTDFNYKLSKMAMNFTLSSDSKKSRRKALEQIQSASEKINALDLKLQKLYCILSNLQEEQHEERKAAKGIFERRSRIPLKDLIYGKRSDLRQQKRRFCACMRLKRTDSNLS
ncbi:hypothetical protein HPP92_012127 [Vanilla planifolia]|uniref:Uncharacterized protein n=1 Tax=Vanilla planifolia TaxID=51239 RepID=A0A835UZ40_VANPL|nr:hypothetical protein HPP92_012127 [Vanilla planifolia]